MLTMHELESPTLSEEDPESSRHSPLLLDESSFRYSYSFTYPSNISATFAVPTHAPRMAPPTPHVAPQHVGIQVAAYAQSFLPHQVLLRLSLPLHFSFSTSISISLSLSLSYSFPAFYHEKMSLLTVGHVCVLQLI